MGTKINQVLMYPPVIDTMMPPFTVDSDGKEIQGSSNYVFFDLSYMQDRSTDPQYFSMLDDPVHSIYSLQATLRSQDSNANMWYETHSGPTGIATCNIAWRAGTLPSYDINSNVPEYPPVEQYDQDSARRVREKWQYNLFHTHISTGILRDQKWDTNQYYKLQLRLLLDPFTVITEPPASGSSPNKPVYSYMTTITSYIQDTQQGGTLNGQPMTFSEMVDKYILGLLKQQTRALYTGQCYSCLKGMLRYLLCHSERGIQWLEENGYVSEWSTVCLIRPLEQPTWILYGSDKNHDHPRPHTQDPYDEYGKVWKQTNPILYQTKQFWSPLIYVSGKLDFPDSDLEPETIIKVTYSLTDSSGLIERYTQVMNGYGTSNNFFYKFKSLLQNGRYHLTIDATSRNGWHDSITIIIMVVMFDETIKHLTFSYKEDNLKGCTILSYTTTKGFEKTQLALCRTDSKSQFQRWEELYYLNLDANTGTEDPEDDNPITYEIPDMTAESGIWYKYGLQIRKQIEDIDPATEVIKYEYGSLYDPTDPINQNTTKEQIEEYAAAASLPLTSVMACYDDPAIYNQTPVMPYYKDLFLTNADGHLAISFDAQVTNYKQNVQEAVVETIGSQYPFVYRNGNVKYRTFQIDGTISYQDNNEIFMQATDDISNNNLKAINYTKGFHASRDELFNTLDDYVRAEAGDTFVKEQTINNYRYYTGQLYKNYNQNNSIYDIDDYTLERRFREKVINFLNSGKCFLLKTAAEGNILVRLTDFSFSPKTELHNLIYNFTCTATEIDACNIDNYNKYNIQYFDQQTIIEPARPIIVEIEKVGQI